jgi:uncharacterized RDD family membrane protein YckC
MDQTTPIDIAGIGARSWAFIIDLHIRLFAAGIVFIATLLLQGVNILNPGSIPNDPIIFLPSLLVYFLYHPVLEILFHGQSPGKRIIGVRITRLNGMPANAWQILIRNLFRVVDCLPGCYSIGLLAGLCTTNQVRIGDKVARTILVYSS